MPKEVSPAPPPKTIIQYIEKEQVQWEPVHSISSLRVKAEKEREMKEAEAYWNKRFVQQEKEVYDRIILFVKLISRKKIFLLLFYSIQHKPISR